jgi:hypothetical protein
MLMAWQGPECIRRLTVSFGRPVMDGESVTAMATMTAIDVVGPERHATCDVGPERHATCDVWLDRDGERVVTGTAVVALIP